MTIMRLQHLCLVATVVAAVATPLFAQVTPPVATPVATPRAGMQESAALQSKAAEFVLQHRAELTLTADQIAKLEVLALAQQDSARERFVRSAERMRASPAIMAFAQTSNSWTGAVDEAAMRDGLCQLSVAQAETMIGIARDRRAVAEVLTPAQIAQLLPLQIGDMKKASNRD